MTGPALLAAPRRLSRPARLDLTLLGCLLLLTLAVSRGWWPVSLDDAVERAVPATYAVGGRGSLLWLAQIVTDVASPTTTVALTLAIAAALALATHSRSPLRHVVPRVAALTVTVLAVKALLHRPGPGGLPLTDLHGYFPSGHTTTALVCTGTLAAMVAERHPEWRARLYVAVAGWTALVGASLVYHRYHWPSDVLGAVLLGLLILRRTPALPDHASPGAQPPGR